MWTAVFFWGGVMNNKVTLVSDDRFKLFGSMRFQTVVIIGIHSLPYVKNNEKGNTRGII